MAPGDPKLVPCREIAVKAAGQADLVHLRQGQKNNGRCSRTSVIDFKSISSVGAGLPTVYSSVFELATSSYAECEKQHQSLPRREAALTIPQHQPVPQRTRSLLLASRQR